MTNVLSSCKVSPWNNIHESHGKKDKFNTLKQRILECWICLFWHDFHECYFMMKLCKNSKHLSMFTEKIIQNFFEFFWIFWDFPIHAKIIWARIEMGNFQHFFHDCKWHAHIGDVFLKILISYLYFSELVWICSEVFKLTVKRSKGKSIRWAKWLGQNRCVFETRGKSDEWDITRGRNVIVPWIYP